MRSAANPLRVVVLGGGLAALSAAYELSHPRQKGQFRVTLYQMGWHFEILRVATFLISMICGMAIAYSCMLLLTSVSVWMVRNQSLMEMWWLFSSVARYPREIFAGTWAAPLGWIFSLVIPVMLVTNVPANVMVKAFDPLMVAYMLAAIMFT